MTYLEKLKEASRLRDIIRKRADRLKKYEEETGHTSDALDAIAENRRKYDQFDPETGHIKKVTRELTEEQLDDLLRQEKQWLKLKTSTVKGARKANIERDRKTGEMLSDITKNDTVKDADYSGFWDTLKDIRKSIKDKSEDTITTSEKQILSDLRHSENYKEVFEEIFEGVEKGWDAKKIGKYLKQKVTKKLKKEAAKRAEEQKKLQKDAGTLPSDLKSAREAIQRRQSQGRLRGNKDRSKKPKQNKKR